MLPIIRTRKKLNIADRRSRVTLCSSDDVVEENGDLYMKREGHYAAWAAIQPIRATQFGGLGYEISNGDIGAKYTHSIAIKFRADIDFTIWAWVFRERRKSGAQWFRVLATTDDEAFFYLYCQLYERGENMIPPAGNNDILDF